MRVFGHTDFDAAFTPGTVFQCPRRGLIRMRQVELGELVLTSGKIVACDPSNLQWPAEIVPFVGTAAVGRHPVTLSIMAVAGDQHVDQRVACAMIRFTTTKPATWRMAVLPGQDASRLGVGQFFGYGVDAGMGCFLDADAIPSASNLGAQQSFCDRMHGGPTANDEFQDWANIPVVRPAGANLAVFGSGYGDGMYASYWGAGAAGELCCLVTDFAILVESLTGRATFQLQDWIGRTISHPDLRRIGLTVRPLLDDAAANHQLDDARRLIESMTKKASQMNLGGIKLRMPSLPERNQLCHHLQLTMEGGDCKAVITNAGKRYSSDRMQSMIRDGVTTLLFRFDEPLEPEAEISLEYSTGVQSLDIVANIV
jgi:hypothetical protein